MGKMPWTRDSRRGSVTRTIPEGRLKADQLRIRKGVQKGLEQDCRFTEAGVEVVVDGVEQFPIDIRLEGISTGEILGRGFKAGIQLVHQICQRGDLVGEL